MVNVVEGIELKPCRSHGKGPRNPSSLCEWGKPLLHLLHLVLLYFLKLIFTG